MSIFKIAIAASIISGGARLVGATEEKLNPKAISFKLPNQIPWKLNAAGTAEKAVLYGDPEKPGLYAEMIRWLPGKSSQPHWHEHDRLVEVIKGTWWVGTGNKYDPGSMVPIPAGSYVTHFGKEIHYDGAKTGEVLLIIFGEGPSTPIPASTPPPGH